MILHGEIAVAADLHERKAVIPLIQNHVVGVEIAQTAGTPRRYQLPEHRRFRVVACAVSPIAKLRRNQQCPRLDFHFSSRLRCGFECHLRLRLVLLHIAVNKRAREPREARDVCKEELAVNFQPSREREAREQQEALLSRVFHLACSVSFFSWFAHIDLSFSFIFRSSAISAFASACSFWSTVVCACVSQLWRYEPTRPSATLSP